MSRTTPLILAVALFMEQMDSTVIATSLPAIAADLGTEPIALKLALTSYLVALAIFIPISGWMCDRFGGRNIFRLAILVFVLGSIGCAFSNSLPTFVASRFLQGAGASMMTPVGRLILVRATPRDQLVSAMAWLAIPGLLGPIMGPPIGGALTTYLSWHWIFWINVPIGFAGILLAGKFLPADIERNPRPIDAVGFVLCSVAFSGLVFGLSVVRLPALPMVYGYLTIAVGVVTVVLYLLHARRTPYPLLDPALLRHKVLRLTIIGGAFFRVSAGGIPFVLPLMLQLGFGYSPFQSGMITFVGAVGAVLSKFFAQWLFARFGFRRSMSLTCFLSGLILLVYIWFVPDTPVVLILATILVSGLLRSVFFTGSNALAYADVSDAEVSQTTAMNAVFQQLTLALGVALAGGVLEVSSGLQGRELGLADFHWAFGFISLAALISTVPFLLLPKGAGDSVSGRKRLANNA